MGLQVSSLNALIVNDVINKRYDIYKFQTLNDVEYFKVEDMIEFGIKKAVEPVLVKDRMAQRVFQLVNKLDHINLVKLDYFYEDGYFYVVREYRDDYYAFAWRLQIQRYLETRRKHIEIEEDQIVYWMKQLLTAVAALHSQNILHKFIIPEAISFHKDVLKLFVPARSTILNNEDEYVVEERTWYRCPEHDQEKCIGLKYDIWSAGWTLYNLCALEDGRFLFEQVETFGKWTRPDIPRVYSRTLDRLFKKMTTFNPELRPSARELLADPIFDKFN